MAEGHVARVLLHRQGVSEVLPVLREMLLQERVDIRVHQHAAGLSRVGIGDEAVHLFHGDEGEHRLPRRARARGEVEGELLVGNGIAVADET